VTSSYIDSILCVLLLLAVFIETGSKPALAFALFLLKIIAITVMKTTTLTTKAVARKLMDIIDAEFMSVEVPVFILIELLTLLVMFPQTTV
jgi:hypothetical protein